MTCTTGQAAVTYMVALLKSFYIWVGKNSLVNGLYQEKPMGKETKAPLTYSKLYLLSYRYIAMPHCLFKDV